MVDFGFFCRTPGDLLAGPVVDDLGFQLNVYAARSGDDPAPPVVGHRSDIGHEERQVPELPPKGVELRPGTIDHHSLD
ncbi:hypothetical protein D3C87_2125750 [compost metagenome]